MLEEIKEKTLEVNANGKIILRLHSLFEGLPQDLQAEYAKKLLTLIQEYYKDIKDLELLVKEFREDEIKNKLPVNLTIKKLERDLLKFNRS